jgi:alkylation response protein AidB-like acyl-CoA dehydrogenase
MEFKLTERQRLLKWSVREFMEKECPREFGREIDEKGEFPFELFKKMANLGWLGVWIPKKYGGEGRSVLELALLMEELGYFLPVIAAPYVDLNIVCWCINQYGTEEQKEDYLRRGAKGEHFCIALTEPDAGSDALSLTTYAIPDGDYYILNGKKVFITGAHIADYLLVFTRSEEKAPKHKGITAFMVDRKSPGILLSKINTLGVKPYYANEVFFNNVRVPKNNIIGGLNEGVKCIFEGLTLGRAIIAAVAVGIAQVTIDDALNYVKKRVQFGQPIGKFQTIQNKLAIMQTEVNAARFLAYNSAWMLSEGMPCLKEASMAKYYATEKCVEITNQGIQILGGYGYSMEFHMQRYFRDSRFLTIGGGTSEIQLLTIAKEMGL